MSDDYIKRKDALDRIITYGKAHKYDDNPCIVFACENLERQMNAIPAADVAERKKGEWIAEVPSSPSAGYLKLRCGECKAEYTFICGTGFFFCPNCGSAMRGEA